MYYYKKFYYNTSISVIIFLFEDNRFNALTSLKLLTSSILLYFCFMHLIATYSPDFNDCAL